MKASLVSATSLVALLAFESGPAMAGPLVSLSDAAGTCDNVASPSTCTLTFFALPGQTASSTLASQSQTVTATYTAGGTLTYTVTFNKPPVAQTPPYTGVTKAINVNTPAGSNLTATSNAYDYTGGASAGATGQSASTAGSFKITVANNTGKGSSQTSTVALQGTTVAPIESTANANAGNVLVGTSQTTTVTVTNAGHGNQATGGASSVSNLNGSVGSAAGVFSGSGGILGGGTGLADSASQAFAYTFAPTIRGTTSTSVTANFSNGDPTGGNASNTAAPTITGTGVAPVQSQTIGNGGNPGSVVNTGNVGYALVGVQTGTATINVKNIGDGNKDTSVATSISNLNGVIGVSGSSVFQGTGTSLSLNDGASTSTNYAFNPTARGTTTTAIVTTFSNGNSSGNNLSQTLTSTLQGQGVAPVEGMSNGGAGFTLVGTSHAAAVTVTNSGDGNLSGLGSVSNLNGSVSGPSRGGVFSGPSPNPLSLKDTSSAAITYIYAPTIRGTDSSTVTGTFTNGSPDNTNSAHTNTALVTGQGVAPIQSTGTSASAGYALVGTSKNLSFTVANTGDGNLDTSVPTSVSNLKGVVGGPVGSAQFGGPSPNPNPISLNDTSSTAVTFQFAPTIRGAD